MDGGIQRFHATSLHLIREHHVPYHSEERILEETLQEGIAGSCCQWLDCELCKQACTLHSTVMYISKL